jgi:glycosyltransferase involved in cell wall biosynthesis
MARAAALGVDAVFAGHRDDVAALLAVAAVFVLPSQWEGQPLALQEALRAGTPVVATKAGGIPELAGDAALLVPPGDAPALAAAVRSVLTDPLLGAALRVAAASRASLLPSPADAVDAALTAYAACLRRPLTPPDEPPARVRSPPASRPRRSAGKPSLRSAIIGGCP